MRAKKKSRPYRRVSLGGAPAFFKAATRRSKNVRRYLIRCVGETPMLQNKPEILFGLPSATGKDFLGIVFARPLLIGLRTCVQPRSLFYGLGVV